jgi:hypothetical protein
MHPLFVSMLKQVISCNYLTSSRLGVRVCFGNGLCFGIVRVLFWYVSVLFYAVWALYK